MHKDWDTIKIKIQETGETVEAIAPLIISASRATDIPAFYADEFMEAINRGWIKKDLPFKKTSEYIYLGNARAFVFWTKNPEALMPYLYELDKKKINYYFTFTLNDYSAEGLEPELPVLSERIATFQKLAAKIGKEKVIWRFDPIALGHGITVESLLEKIKNVGDKVYAFTEKLVISFIDIEAYAKVKNRLKRNDFEDLREPTLKEMEQIAQGIKKLNKLWRLQVCSCVEIVSLEKYGIKHNKCIDDELMKKIFSHDKKLMDFFGVGKGAANLFGMDMSGQTDLKDKAQRKLCGCVKSKDIGNYNTCGSCCLYCYAGFRKQ